MHYLKLFLIIYQLTLGTLTNISYHDYYKMAEDGFSKEETKLLYEDYYKESPESFVASATWYGDESISFVEMDYYGKVIRQQMERGWVLVGSGEFGYQKEFSSKLSLFVDNNYPYMNSNDYLLSKQASPLYYYFADGGNNRIRRDKRNQPIPVTYDELNERQKRIYDITLVPSWEMEEKFFDYEQYKLTPNEAIESGKYASIVSTKSPNDFGKRYMIFKIEGNGDYRFYGIVLVGGTLKRDDWVGFGATTNDTFDVFNYPVIVRRTKGQHWGFDFPTKIYKWFEGKGGSVTDILAIEIID